MIQTLAHWCRPSAHGPAPLTDPALEALLKAATGHDVLGLVAGTLQSGRAGPLGADVEEALAIYREALQIEQHRAHAQLAELLPLFAARNIPIMPFKGPAVALAYPDPALRPCRDLDLMVRAADVPAVVACLEQAGFTHERHLDAHGLLALRHYAGEYIMFRAGSLPVEPHWRPAPWTMAFDIDQDGLWRRAQRTDVLGVPSLAPSPEDLFLLLALHGAKEQWHKLKWLADLPAFLTAHPGLDHAAMRRLGASCGCRRVIDLALLLSHLLFAVPLASPPADRTTQRLARSVLARLDRTSTPPRGPYVVTVFHWQLRERWRDRLRYATRTLLTPRVAHYNRIRLPPHLRWLLVPLKLPWDYVLTPTIGLLKRLHNAT